MAKGVAQQMTYKQLYRSRDAYIAGVCAGIAEYLEFDPIVIRILAVLFAVTTVGIGGIVYLALWAYIPRSPEPQAPYDVTPESAESSVYGSLDCIEGDDVSPIGGDEEYGRPSMVQRLAVAVGLMVLFLLVATNLAPIVSGTQWWQFWPLAFLIIGLCLIVIPVRTRFESAWHAAGIAITSLAATMLPMSLGLLSWDTLGHAVSGLWFLLVIAIVLFGIGIRNHAGNLMIGAAFFITGFCLITLISYALPGDLEALTIVFPDGNSLRIALLPGLQ